MIFYLPQLKFTGKNIKKTWECVYISNIKEITYFLKQKDAIFMYVHTVSLKKEHQEGGKA